MNNGVKIALGCLGVIIIAVFMIGGTVIRAKNTMVVLNENIDGQWAQVENQLKRRNDLIPNLVNTVKGYAKHEKEIFTDIAEARSKLGGARTVDEKVQASSQLEGALSRLLMVVERYPDLKADKQFMNLQAELAGTENRIAVERMRFNETVKVYNTYVKKVPGAFFAMIFGYKARAFFEVSEAEKAVPTVDFGAE